MLRKNNVNRDRVNGGILVLGMHRSGTSCLAGSLQSHGLNFGNVSEPNQHNKKGHVELGAIRKINERILEANGGSWQEPVPALVKPSFELAKAKIIIAGLKLGRRPWGIKDPRMLFCEKIWPLENCRYIATFRHPSKVVASLSKRAVDAGEYRSEEYWLNIWKKYNSALLLKYEAGHFPIVCFDWQKDRYIRFIKSACSYLELGESDNEFFEENLRVSSAKLECMDSESEEMYAKLVDLAEAEETYLIKNFL